MIRAPIAIILGIAGIPAFAYQGSDFVPYQTREGCQVQFIRADALPGLKTKSLSWSGECRNGLASGVGTLAVSFKYNTYKIWQKYNEAGLLPYPAWMISEINNKLVYERYGGIASREQCREDPQCELLANHAEGQSGLRSTPANSKSMAYQTAEGFEFTYFASKDKLEAMGGPCADANVYSTELLGSVKNNFSQIKKGTWRSNYGIYAIAHIDGLDVHFTLSPEVNWAGTVAESPPNERATVRCLSMNYPKYVEAYEGWLRKNMSH